MERILRRLRLSAAGFSLLAALLLTGACAAVAAPTPVPAASSTPGPKAEVLLALDISEFEPRANRVRLEGWYLDATPGRRVAEVVVASDAKTVRWQARVVRRADVVQATGRPDAFDAGWAVSGRWPVDDLPPEALALTFLASDGAVLYEAKNITPAPQVVPDLPFVHRAVAAGTAAVLLVLLAGRVLRRRSSPVDAPSSGPSSGARAARTTEAGVTAAAVVLLAAAFGAVTPPFQSPDEFDHVERAYQLSAGQWLQERPAGRDSGGQVDAGLMAYVRAHAHLPFDRSAVVGAQTLEVAEAARWQERTVFATAPGAGLYLPVIYLPQAAAFATGRALDWPIDTSYRAARWAALLLAALALFEALRRWRLPLVGVVLLLLPMTLFQWASAAIDGLAMALSMLAVALTMEAMTRGRSASARRIAAVGALVIVVVGSRPQLLPLLALPLALAWPRDWAWRAAGLAPAALLAAWFAFAMQSVRSTRMASDGIAERLLAHLADPGGVVSILWNTATTPKLMDFYGRSFIGELGWLDTTLPAPLYATFAAVLAATLVWSVVDAEWRKGAGFRFALMGLAGLSALLVPLLMLLMWTPAGAVAVDGIQGRYFLVPALLASMALSAGQPPAARGERVALAAIAFVIALYVASVTLPTLVHRYYVPGT
jgi:uncharacterized membrane protein